VGNRSGEAGPSWGWASIGPFRIRSAWAVQPASACPDFVSLDLRCVGKASKSVPGHGAEKAPSTSFACGKKRWK
jgi:hypothetical protein